MTIRNRLPWRAVLLCVTWWVIVQMFALIAFSRVQLTTPDNAYIWTSQRTHSYPVLWRGFVQYHANFDSGFYTWIAGEGYNAQNAAYLPLYPLLIKLGATVWCTPQGLALPTCDYDALAFVLSNLSALGAAVAIYQLARVDGDEPTALQSLFYVLVFPTAFFLTANYTESLFILLAATSFHTARRGRWVVASGVGALAMLTRVSGLCLFAALVVEWWSQRKARDWRGVWLVLIPLAFGLFIIYLQARGLSFFATEQALWNRAPFSLDSLPDHLEWDWLQAQPAALVNLLLDVGIGVFVVTASAVAAWRWRWSYGVYGALCILLPLTTGQTISLSRYGLVAFTAPMVLARFGHHGWLDRAYTLIAILLLALYTLLWVQGYWAG